MLIASRHDGNVPMDPEYIRRVAYFDSAPDLRPLIDCGFLELTESEQADASTMLALARPETEAETEAETEKRCKSEALAKRTSKSKTKSKGSIVWDAYSDAYLRRYSVAPTRNAKTNALCKQLVDRLGADEAPSVAEYYLTSRNAFYVARGHSLVNLVADAEKLRTEWATGRQITQSAARESDRLAETANSWQAMIEKHGDKDE
jgi:hypothetical protein